MKRLLGLSLLLCVVMAAGYVPMAATQVRVCGAGGNDTAIVEEMIQKFINPKLKDQGIVAVYEPIADNYQQQITTALSSGTAADLFYVDIFWAQGLIKTGAIEPLDKYIGKSKILHKKDIIPSLLDAFSYQGKIYGIAKDFNTLALFYNKDLFDLAKVPYPDESDTWATLEAKLKKISDPAKGIFGMALAPDYARMGALAYGAGFKPFDKNGKSNLQDPAFKSAFEWYTGLAAKKLGVMPADIGQGWGGGAFQAEKVATCLEGAWLIGSLKDNAPNLKYGATLLPKAPKTGKRGNFIFTVSWSMNKNSTKKDAAFKVLEVLTSPEVQQWVLERGLAIPSRTALADNPYFKQDDPAAKANAVVFKGASSGNVLPFSFRQYGGDWMNPINEALSQVMSGQADVDRALKEAQQKLDVVFSKIDK